MNYETRALLEKTYNRARGLATAFGIAYFALALGVEVFNFVFAPFEGLLALDSRQLFLLRAVLIGTIVLDSAVLPALRRALTPRGDEPLPAQMIPRLFMVSVTTLGITSSAAVLGLGLFLVSGQSLDFYGFWFVSVVFLVLYYPRLAQWEQMAGY